MTHSCLPSLRNLRGKVRKKARTHESVTTKRIWGQPGPTVQNIPWEFSLRFSLGIPGVMRHGYRNRKESVAERSLG